jgi:hypothetical protein
MTEETTNHIKSNLLPVGDLSFENLEVNSRYTAGVSPAPVSGSPGGPSEQPF